MGCGEWCVYYRDKGKTSACFNCSDYIPPRKSRFELEKVNIFELAAGLQKKEQEKRRKNPVDESSGSINDNIVKETEDYRLSICPVCNNSSLFYYKLNKRTSCLNKQCASNNPVPTQSPGTSNIKEIKAASIDAPELNNPMLLTVKMFLSEITYVLNRKYEEGHVCSDFSTEVCDSATERGIRCGYVVIYFKNSEIAHAIVAFQTDYGLKYFEPQNGNEVDVLIGRRYFAQAKGASEENIISKINIQWNDGAVTEIE